MASPGSIEDMRGQLDAKPARGRLTCSIGLCRVLHGVGPTLSVLRAWLMSAHSLAAAMSCTGAGALDKQCGEPLFDARALQTSLITGMNSI